MSRPSESELLATWERGWPQPPPERALTLLDAARPDLPPEARGCLTVGARDAALLAFRERLFGPDLTGWDDCPDCGARAEFTLRVAEILAEARVVEKEVLIVVEGGYEVRARLPRGDDLVGLARFPDSEAARRHLLARCILSAVDLVRATGPELTVGDLPGTVLDALEHAMAEADPLADIRLALDCPSCPARWSRTLDVVAFLWAELDAWARRLLLDVHALASAYGWDEPTTLGLSPWRRACYLDMVRA